jgi:hypothetical protein
LRLSIGGNDWFSIVRTTGAATFTNTLSVSATTASTSTTTGSLVNAGGFGNVGAAYIGGPVSTGSRFVFTGPGALPGASELAIGTNGVGTRILSNVPTGGEFNFTVNGTTVTAINATTGLYTTGLINSTNTTASTSTTTGSLINAGGFGNAGAIFAGGTITSATASHNSITSAAASNLTLAGGSSGASLLLSQGANGRATLSAKGTEAVLLIGRNQSNTSTPSFSFYQQNQGPGNEYLDIGFLESPFSTWFQARRVSGSTGSSISLQPADGNVLIGGTTDISGTGGLKVFGTTASTSTTTGSLVNAGGFGNAGAAWFGGQINSASSGLLFSRTGASTALQYLDIANTGGRVQFGVETSTGGNFFGGATAYATVLASATSAPVQIAVNAIHAATFSSTAVSIPLTTASTSTTTGSLVNAGGFGNAGAAFIGGNATVFGAAGITINNVGGSGNDSILTLTQSGVSNAFIKNTATTGDIAIGDGGGTYLRITKGAGVVFVSNTTASSSTTTGSLVNAGGFGCAGAAYFGGAIAIGNTVNTVSPTSPNRTVTIVIGGTTYYLHAKTTND